MAGDWIKFELSTLDKPEVWAISDALHIDPDAVVGKLLRVWGWFDQQTETGNAPSVTKKLLDRNAGVTGFCDAMISAGWMQEDESGISVPKFDRHNGKSAKKRAVTARRVADYKKSNAGGNGEVTPTALPNALPREEKRREEKNIKKNLQKKSKSTDGPPDEIEQEFTALWKIYPKRSGSNPKARALAAYRKQRGKSELMAETIRTGVELYAAWCQATGKIGTEYVMQAAKFLGPDQHFLNDWAAPPGQQRARDAPSPYAPDDTSWADNYGADSAIEGEFVNEDLAHDRLYESR